MVLQLQEEVEKKAEKAKNIAQKRLLKGQKKSSDAVKARKATSKGTKQLPIVVEDTEDELGFDDFEEVLDTDEESEEDIYIQPQVTPLKRQLFVSLAAPSRTTRATSLRSGTLQI